MNIRIWLGPLKGVAVVVKMEHVMVVTKGVSAEMYQTIAKYLLKILKRRTPEQL